MRELDPPEENGPTLRECMRIDANVYAAVAALLGLSFLAERAILFFGAQLPQLPVVAMAFFGVMLALVLVVNNWQHRAIFDEAKPGFQRWYELHRNFPIRALPADVVVLSFGVVPTLVAFQFVAPPWNAPHLICVAVLLNLRLVCPRRQPMASNRMHDNF